MSTALARDAAERHRQFDRAEPKVLLCQLAVRKSARTGRNWLSGWLGKSRLVGFQAAEPDRFGNPVFDLYLQAVSEPPRGRELVTVDGAAEP